MGGAGTQSMWVCIPRNEKGGGSFAAESLLAPFASGAADKVAS